MKPLAFGLCVLLCSALAAQSPPGASDAAMSRADRRERTLAGRLTSPPQGRPARRVDVAQLRRDAQELAQLERTVQAEIADAERGVVSKSLGGNLKKMQKLSKRLRAELFL